MSGCFARAEIVLPEILFERLSVIRQPPLNLNVLSMPIYRISYFKHFFKTKVRRRLGSTHAAASHPDRAGDRTGAYILD